MSKLSFCLFTQFVWLCRQFLSDLYVYNVFLSIYTVRPAIYNMTIMYCLSIYLQSLSGCFNSPSDELDVHTVFLTIW